MCRYAFKTYKSHFACFHCRKTFKQANEADLIQRTGKLDLYEKLMRKSLSKLTEQESVQLAQWHELYKDREIKCPECGGPMADLGLDFKSPKQSAVKQWKIIESLYTIGKSFQSCGCTGPGYIPRNTKDYRAYLSAILSEYEASIAHYQKKTLKECRDKAQRIAYWGSKAEAVRLEMVNI